MIDNRIVLVKISVDWLEYVEENDGLDQLIVQLCRASKCHKTSMGKFIQQQRFDVLATIEPTRVYSFLKNRMDEKANDWVKVNSLSLLFMHSLVFSLRK